jgi:NAD(P)-dependent dehydrogenase (short-subunit alcohol dehydrogenase family)
MSLFVVTGAGRGIGLELCRQLRERGETVVAAVAGPDPSSRRSAARSSMVSTSLPMPPSPVSWPLSPAAAWTCW